MQLAVGKSFAGTGGDAYHLGQMDHFFAGAGYGFGTQDQGLGIAVFVAVGIFAMIESVATCFS